MHASKCYTTELFPYPSKGVHFESRYFFFPQDRYYIHCTLAQPCFAS
jgi:hypothetical protein